MHTLPLPQRPSTAALRAPRAWRINLRKPIVVRATVAKEAPAAAQTADACELKALKALEAALRCTHLVDVAGFFL